MLSHAQKIIEKVITVDKVISTVIINLEHVFSIHLKSTTANIISLKAISEGEYAPHFIITEKCDKKTINLSGSIAFTYPNNQDKLSAHKVHAITIEIEVPEHLKTTINSDIGNLSATGRYKGLVTKFMSGNCTLNDVSGNITIHTVNGDIYLVANSGKVVTETKTGLVKKEALVAGNSIFELKTTKGNINIEQSK